MSTPRPLGAAADICLLSSKLTGLETWSAPLPQFCRLPRILSPLATALTILVTTTHDRFLGPFLSEARRAVFTMDAGSTDQMPRHPFLDQPMLYVNGLPEYVRDQDIAQALEACVPFRPQIVRDGSSYSHGSILFKSLERGVWYSIMITAYLCSSLVHFQPRRRWPP